MKSIVSRCLLSVVGVGLMSSAASADTLFMKALKTKYDFKLVSCNTCHKAGKDEAGKAFGQKQPLAN
jgi:hypothetical protein